MMRTLAILLVTWLCTHSAVAAVTITSVTDQASPEASARAWNAEAMRRALADVVAPIRGPARQIDASIVSWKVEKVGAWVEVTAALQFAICDERGRLISIVSGHATVTARGRTAYEALLRELQRQAVETAVGSAAQPLRVQLGR